MRAQYFIITLLVSVSLLACTNNRELKGAEEKIKDTQNQAGPSAGIFDWLLGNWIRTNEKKDKQTFENWDKKNDAEYIGLGYTLQNNDTIWKENVRLIKLDTIWNFEVTGKGETKPTIFTVTEIQENEFTCENKENEFPKKIKYYKNVNNLSATISGGDTEIPFEFEKAIQKK